MRALPYHRHGFSPPDRETPLTGQRAQQERYTNQAAQGRKPSRIGWLVPMNAENKAAIAAAPELLEALEAALDYNYRGNPHLPWMDLAMVAIATATGK